MGMIWEVIRNKRDSLWCHKKAKKGG